MEKHIVIAVENSWCSCGCCVPFGTGTSGQNEAPADIYEAILNTGETVEVVGSQVKSGDVVYQDDDGFWYKDF